METLDNLIDQLQKIKDIFTKNPNRDFKSEYVLNKITTQNKIRQDFNLALANFREEDKILVDSKIEKFKNINKKLTEILELKSKLILEKNYSIRR